jgi:hypothetical protein
MDRDCPGCARAIVGDQQCCDFCGYEFRPVALIEAKEPPTRWFSMIANFGFGAMLLAGGAHYFTEFNVFELAGQAQLQARSDVVAPLQAAAPKSLAGYHRVERTNQGGPQAFRIRGKVFDILSLENVGGATLVFHDRASGKFYGAFAQADGSYDAYLPVTSGGYYLTAHHDGYERGFLEDWEPSLRQAHAEVRLEMAADTRKNPAELHVHGSRQAILERDLVVVPRDGYVPEKYNALN